jgi:elongation factor Ts
VAEISAAAVKELREKTGVGMMDCKKALQEAEGDLKRATDILRERGIAKAVKRAERATKEGRIQAGIRPDKRVGSIVEVNIETDFAARNEKFGELVNVVCQTALDCKCNSLDDILAAKPANGAAVNVETLVTDAIGVIGENMSVRHCKTFEIAKEGFGFVHSYIHPPGKVGVLVELVCENQAVAAHAKTAELAHEICLQAAFSNPVSLDALSISPELIASEREVYRNQTLQEGKPEKMVDKIVDGRIKAFFKEVCLLEQMYVKDDKKSITDLVNESSKAAGGKIEVTRFVRYELGS